VEGIRAVAEISGYDMIISQRNVYPYNIRSLSIIPFPYERTIIIDVQVSKPLTITCQGGHISGDGVVITIGNSCLDIFNFHPARRTVRHCYVRLVVTGSEIIYYKNLIIARGHVVPEYCRAFPVCPVANGVAQVIQQGYGPGIPANERINHRVDGAVITLLHRSGRGGRIAD